MNQNSARTTADLFDSEEPQIKAIAKDDQDGYATDTDTDKFEKSQQSQHSTVSYNSWVFSLADSRDQQRQHYKSSLK